MTPVSRAVWPANIANTWIFSNKRISTGFDKKRIFKPVFLQDSGLQWSSAEDR